MHITLNLDRLTQYAERVLARPVTLDTVDTSRIEGGYVAAGVYRHDLLFRLDDGSSNTFSVVQKYTYDAEVRVMQALAGVTGAHALPLLIDSLRNSDAPDDNGASWFITPFYDGSFLTWEDEVPPSVIESLVRTHIHFAFDVAEWNWLYHVDAAFIRRTFDNALAALRDAMDEGSAVVNGATLQVLKQLSEDPKVYAALAELPLTLTHGDVHPANIIHTSSGEYFLIDWGNARIAPAMLDLANVIEIDSDTWNRYLSAWEGITGVALDTNVARLGYHWATVIINVQYLPFAVSHRPKNAESMIERAVRAAELIATSGWL